MPDACQDFKQFRLQFTGIPPRLKFIGFSPHWNKCVPSISTLASLILSNSQALNTTASSTAWVNSDLLHFQLFCLFYTTSAKLELAFLQQGHVKLPLDLKIHLGFLKMMQPQTLILEFLFCISFLETPTNTSEHLSRGF